MRKAAAVYLALWLATAAGGEARAQEPFAVLEETADFQLVRVEDGAGFATTDEPRCFIRSKPEGLRPALFFYPANRSWALALPEDIYPAADWQRRHLRDPDLAAIEVTFDLRIDDRRPYRYSETIRQVNPHRRRTVRFPEEERGAIYRQLREGQYAVLAWSEDSLGGAVDKALRRSFGEPTPPGQVRYALDGLAALIDRAAQRCRER